MTDHCPACPFKGCDSCAYKGSETVTAQRDSGASHNKGVMDRSAYFAAICWKRLRAMQEIAEQIVAGDDAP